MEESAIGVKGVRENVVYEEEAQEEEGEPETARTVDDAGGDTERPLVEDG